MSHLIAIDIGGTQIRAGCYRSHDFAPLKVAKIPTQHATEPAIDRLLDVVSDIWPEDGEVLAIGAAAPGPVDPYQGVIRDAPNIPGWENVPLQRLLEERFQAPAALGNDANLAAMGEWRFGAGKGHHHLLYLTVSTGIGGGVIVDDKLLLGVHGLAAELGHISVVPDGPMCGCGQRGHLEAIASGPALTRWVKEELENGAPSSLSLGDNLSAKVIAAAALGGDALSIAALERSGSYIGLALASYLHIFNPSIVLIGGGVSLCGKLLLDPIWKAMEEGVMNPYYLDNITLTTAALGDEAGLMGALALAAELSTKVVQTHF